MMKNPPYLTLLAFALASPAAAETFQVDINGGNGPTQSGWSAFDPTGPTVYPDAFGPGVPVTVAIAQVGDVRDKNRGTTITGPHASLNNLLVDFYGSRNVGNVVTLSLTLPAGAYSFKSYHHDAENNPNNSQDVTAAIVQNAAVTGISNPSSSFVIDSGATNLVDFDTYETDFTLTESGTVQFSLTKTAGNGEHGFNGFEITRLGPVGGPEITDFQVTPPNTVEIIFSTIPGNQYEIRNGTMLNDFTPLDTLIAEGTSETYTRSGVTLLDREFFVVEDLGEAPPLFQADFETGDGGFTVAANSSGTLWEHGMPDSDGLSGSISGGAVGSAGAWGTNLGNASLEPTDSAFDEGYYETGTSTRLRSPVIDLTGATSATLSFDEAVDMAGEDSGVVNIIDDDSDDIIVAAIHESTNEDLNSTAWGTVSGIELPAAALGRPIRLEFEFVGDGGTTLDWMGWYIDNVVISR